MEEKVRKRLIELYNGRTIIEKRLMHNLRFSAYKTTSAYNKDLEYVDNLRDYSMGIQEFENLLGHKVVKEIKEELGIVEF